MSNVLYDKRTVGKQHLALLKGDTLAEWLENSPNSWSAKIISVTPCLNVLGEYRIYVLYEEETKEGLKAEIFNAIAEFWQGDETLAVGVPFLRMATQAAQIAVDILHKTKNKEEENA